MLIRRLCTVKVYNTRPFYTRTIEVFTEVFACSKVIIAFKRSTSFASIFCKLSSQNKLACRHKKKLKKCLHFKSLAAKGSETNEFAAI